MSDGVKLLESMSLELEACGEVSYEDPAPVVADLRRIATRLSELERDAERLDALESLKANIDYTMPVYGQGVRAIFSHDADGERCIDDCATVREALDELRAALNRAKETT
jgi:hypothetical protein